MIKSDNITSEICINCICLPVCINKNYTHTAADCAYVRSLFFDISKSIRFGEEVDVHFSGIDKTYFVNCTSCIFSIGAYLSAPKRKTHIFSYPTDELCDIDFGVEGKDLKFYEMSLH